MCFSFVKAIKAIAKTLREDLFTKNNKIWPSYSLFSVLVCNKMTKDNDIFNEYSNRAASTSDGFELLLRPSSYLCLDLSNLKQGMHLKYQVFVLLFFCHFTSTRGQIS